MNKLMHPKYIQVLLAITIALLVGNLAASTNQATANMESVQIAQSSQPIPPQPGSEPQAPLGNSFTYQGRLKDGPNPANGQYDFTFKLFDAQTGGTQVGPVINLNGHTVSEGLVTASLNFGAGRFQGETRYLEVAVRPTGGGNFTTLVPRQPITPAPNSLFSLDVPPHDNVVVVAKSGGDFTTISSALSSITDASATNRYIIRVGPGVYSERVTMKQYVDIEGSGEGTTRLTTAGGPTSFLGGSVIGNSNAALRSLTVENTGGDDYAIAIYSNAHSPALLNVTAIASGGTTESYGVYNVNNASPLMENVSATGSGGNNAGGIMNDDSSPTMTNVTASASGAVFTSRGVYNDNGSAPRMTNVTASASGGQNAEGVRNLDGSSPTMTNVTASASGASDINFGVRNGNGSSPAMSGGRFSASGGENAYGVANSSDSSPRMTSVTVVASGAADNVGVSNGGNSVPTILDSDIVASGNNASNAAVNLDASGLRVQNSNLHARNGFINFVLHVDHNDTGSFSVRINNSTLRGDIWTGDAYNIFIGGSHLDGGIPIPRLGTLKCAGVYDEDYDFFANTCP